MEKIFQTHFKFCPMCREAKQIENFSKNKTKSDGLTTYCKDCDLERMKRKSMEKKIYDEGEKMPFDWIW